MEKTMWYFFGPPSRQFFFTTNSLEFAIEMMWKHGRVLLAYADSENREAVAEWLKKGVL